MKTLVSCLLLPVLLSAQPRADIPSLGDKPVQFTVRDTSGNPVAGATVEASRHGPGNATGQADKEGRLTLQLTKGASLYVRVAKDGYYPTGGEIWSGGMVKGPDRKLVAKEVPDRFEITLKEIREPVLLLHVRYRGYAPDVDEPIGFDLGKGDWVAPHGTGAQTDVFFYFHGIEKDPDGYAGTLTLSFPHPKDGLREFTAARPLSREFGSALAPPHKAPVDGYQPARSFSIQHRQGEPYSSYMKHQQNYLFRVRSRTDANGKLRQACYGWIEGEIEFDPRGSRGPQVVFNYFLNADPDPQARSLEMRGYVPSEP